MDIVETLRVNPDHNALREQAANEIERLRVENALFRNALKTADQAIAAAPIWHAQHRVLSEVIGGLKKSLGQLRQGRGGCPA